MSHHAPDTLVVFEFIYPSFEALCNTSDPSRLPVFCLICVMHYIRVAITD